ncbi:protein CLT2, chloroplastic-like [Actinidia eriantha]|uniref:protein CLT2, chloroplastic-like n=1 Tax=Actinidia eriantha TaxID=165200 RepID=UPI0025847732|nr:protein CLT2, chloroplastic-like [Actinidia eriantha]
MGYSCISSAKIHHFKSPNLGINGRNPSSLTFMSLPQNPRSTSTHLPPKRPFNAHFKVHHRLINRIQQYPSPNHRFTVRATAKERSDSEASSNTKLIVAFSAITVVLAVANRVLYKLALVPMKEYPFFLAQVTTFGYVAIYFSILYMRYRGRIVTDEMMAIPKSPFIMIGILEALGVAAGMSAGAMLPGPAIPILSQTFLVWQLAFSTLLLGRKYSWNKITGCLLVAAGVVVAVTSGSDTNQMLSGIGFVWPMLMIASSAFQAGASILKESVFVDAATRLKGKLLDIFVVNSFGSGFQALFVLLFLPFLSNMKGIPFSQLPLYIKNGAGCFFNIGAHTLGCDGAPLLPLLFIVTNIAFNISLLSLLKISSAVLASLVSMSSVPISIYILSLPLPYLPEGATLSSFFLFGSMILVIGLLLYNVPQPVNRVSEID